MANFDFVVNSHFTPFTMQEMLTPFLAYKEAYDKAEEAYDKLSEADDFKYLSKTLPEGSQAREIYEGYANDLKDKAEDFARNGYNAGNSSALFSLKRRYRGEIGRLMKADEAMKEEKKLRQTLNAQDSSRLYATDNLSIDDFLDGGNPNLYSISGNELNARGAAAAKAFSSRLFNVNGEAKTLGGYYLDFAQSVGYDPDKMKAFAENITAIPELAAQVDNILIERGVYKNLSGESLKRARQSVINGMLEGAVYSETHNPTQNLGVLTKAQQEELDLKKQAQYISLATNGLTYNEKTHDVTYNIDKDPALQKAKAIAEAKAQGKTGSSSSAYNTRNKGVIMVGAKTGKLYKHTKDANTVAGLPLKELERARVLNEDEVLFLRDKDGNILNQYLRSAIGNGDLSDYEISILPLGATEVDGSGVFSDDKTDEDIYIITPRETKRAASEEFGNVSENGGHSDVPT